MRTLCLHGQGTSASIFRSQTVAFRSKLDKSFEFDFVDAPFTCPPSPGVELLFKSRNYTWWPESNIESIRNAHKWLLAYLEKNGPYDNVCCFSQGCSLIATFLLYHAKEAPHAPLPFKSAFFICGGLPLIVLEDLGLPVSAKAHDFSARTGKQLKAKASAFLKMAVDHEQIQLGVGLWDDTTDLLHDPNVLPGPSDVFGLDFTSFPKDIRIKIPTVNIVGGKDPRWPAGMQLAQFCENGVVYDHGGGHDIPRRSEVSHKIAELFRFVESSNHL